MLGIVKEINGEKKIIPLTTDTGTGAPVGTLIQQYKKKPISGYLYCDGSTFDENVYPALYMYLGTNVLPDYRECVMVGAEQNTTDTIATHDVYGEGEFKDDQLQSHTHYIIDSVVENTVGYGQASGQNAGITDTKVATTLDNNRAWIAGTDKYDSESRLGTTTHGKQKAVYVYIKATSGLAENQQDNVLNATKDYVDNSNSYSTEEVKTGGTWIDGKPIYRKVIVRDVSGSLSGLVSIDIDIANIDTPIRIVCGNISLPDGSGAITIPAQYDATTFVQFGAFRTTGLQLYCGSTNWTPLTHITLCLEYTKTTD